MAGGLVIATHDLDAWFPQADRVLVLDGGRVLADLTPQALCARPELLLQARVGLPSSTRLAQEFGKIGLHVPSHPVPPAEMAQAILKQLPQMEPVSRQQTAEQAAEQPRQADPALLAIPALPAAKNAQTPFVQELDPRAKWAFYLLVSIGILLQGHWFGVLFAALLTLACVRVSRVPSRDILKMTLPFFYFIVFSVILSGIRFHSATADWQVGSVGFSYSAALLTFEQLLKILLVMVLGLLLPATTSQLKMKKGLEQALAVLQRLKLPVEAFSLAASLMLRFVPVIMREMDRFSRITRARGKSNARVGRFKVRDVNAIVVPLLISVLQLGEDLSTAMEARGYSRMGMKRTSSVQLHMKRADWNLLGSGVLLLAILLLLAYLHISKQ